MNELLYYDLKDASGVAPGLATQVSREIGRRIVGGHYREDELIEDETKLSDRFGVSKSVVREAVKLLVGKGPAGSAPGQRYTSTPPCKLGPFG